MSLSAFQNASRHRRTSTQLLGILLLYSSFSPLNAENPGFAFFEKKIRPVLSEHCYECHSVNAKKVGGKLLLDSRTGILKGGESGPLFDRDNPEESLIVQALRWVDELEMPPEDPLPETVAHDFVKWIKLGTPDPRSNKPSSGEENDPPPTDPAALWSFQPVTVPKVPDLQKSDWVRDPIDQFILTRLEAEGHEPTRDADAETLMRRLHFDLIGLAPTAGELASFRAEFATDKRAALESLVDRLLATPQFGERWGRHWLDVARYGESNGNDGLGRNPTFPNAWRYRDYVIAAFNADLPYDRFVTEQIAGDLLPATTADERNRQLTATGFLAIGYKPAAAMNQNFAMDVVDDQINVVSTAVMGLSVSCARCHDHKHDPIPTRDYYAMAGVFNSTETLWGSAANEKLTAPPTPLHALRDTLEEPAADSTKEPPPDFAKSYGESIESLEPVVHARLDEKPEDLVIEKGVKFSSEQFAEVKEGRIRLEAPIPAHSYTVAFWFRNDLDNSARAITTYLFSHASPGDKKQTGDHIGIGGTHDKSLTGKFYLWNGVTRNQNLAGHTVIPTGSWNHVILVRSGKKVRLYLNGDPKPEIEGEMDVTAPDDRKIFLGARNDRFAPLQGSLAEFAVWNRALDPAEAQSLHAASGQPRRTHRKALGWAMGARDKKKIANCKVNIDGNSKKLGPVVPRGFLSACKTSSDPPSIDETSSGRLQLAEWLTSGDHPQTSRVMTNRIWLHLFGRPIVTTPDDFGVYGARPSHPELLDHLAHRFVTDLDWSVKKMIRTIVFSRTYQLDSRGAASELLKADPDNILMARHSRRRLDAESLRDRMLQASGRLNLSPPAGSAIDDVDILLNWPAGEAKYLHEASTHRSIYLCMLRDSPPPELSAFDLPDGIKVAGKRDLSTAPNQALYLFNNLFVIEQARVLAESLLDNNPSASDEDHIHTAYQRALQREPTQAEVVRSVAHLREVFSLLASEGTTAIPQAWTSLCQALLASSEFRYVD
ncbi:MAG: DUF1549 domain-containing protein [Akkermansiaceae bacterium]|nr:DUF1549 domain-containing protein [Akkermansiaceae bacterium]